MYKEDKEERGEKKKGGGAGGEKKAVVRNGGAAPLPWSQHGSRSQVGFGGGGGAVVPSLPAPRYPRPGAAAAPHKAEEAPAPSPQPQHGEGPCSPRCQQQLCWFETSPGKRSPKQPRKLGGGRAEPAPQTGGGLLRTSRAGRAGLEPPHSPHPPGRCLPGPDRARASPPRAGGHSRAAAPSPGGLFSLFIFVKRHFQPRGAQRCRGLSPGRGGERRGEGQHCSAARGRAGGSREPPRSPPRAATAPQPGRPLPASWVRGSAPGSP